MEEAPTFDEEAFRKKFKDNGQQKISSQKLRDILAQLEFEQHHATVQKIARKNSKLKLGKKDSLPQAGKTGNAIPKKVEQQGQEQQEQEQQKQEDGPHQDDQTEFQDLLDEEDALVCARLMLTKIKKEIWLKTANIYGLQHQLVKLSWRSSFPIKDPGHYANINILVGEQQQNYNSFVHVKLKKRPHKALPGEEVTAKVKIMTESLEESKKFQKLWDALYELIRSMVEGQVVDGASFMKSLIIKGSTHPNCFELNIISHNPDLNEFACAISNFPNVVLKTDVRAKLDFLLQFVFDLKKYIEDPQASLYDFLTKNIRIKLKYIGSEYVSAIKELMIAAQAFKDLSWVNDDEQSLLKILGISTHSIEMNLKFKNATNNEQGEQKSLQQVLALIMQQVRPMIAESQQSAKEGYDMVLQACKKEIRWQVHAYDWHLSGQLFIQNIDKIFLEDAEVMKGFEPDSD